MNSRNKRQNNLILFRIFRSHHRTQSLNSQIINNKRVCRPLCVRAFASQYLFHNWCSQRLRKEHSPNEFCRIGCCFWPVILILKMRRRRRRRRLPSSCIATAFEMIFKGVMTSSVCFGKIYTVFVCRPPAGDRRRLYELTHTLFPPFSFATDSDYIWTTNNKE